MGRGGQSTQAPATDFYWSSSEEPHASRRKEILKAHPEVKRLFGHDPNSKFVAFGVVLLQFLTAFTLTSVSPTNWKFIVAAYVIGGTCNHNLFLAIHEMSHDLFFKTTKANQWYSMFVNLPIGAPYCVAFKGYHLDHHKQQGVDGADTDVPSYLEVCAFASRPMKLLWCFTQILFYALRPMAIKRQNFTKMHAINWAIQLGFDALIIYLVGWRPVIYFLMSTFFAGSLHPTAGHFISEHYVFNEGHETYSYYGPLNILAYNVGYHNEHHDFPNIPGSRLPQVKALAPEFYDKLPQTESWPGTIWKFVNDPRIGPHSRIKRKPANKRD